MWFIGVKVEQQWSAPPPKKNPGSAADFSHFSAQVRLFFLQKRKPKIFGFENKTERRIRKILTLVFKNFQGKK